MRPYKPVAAVLSLAACLFFCASCSPRNSISELAFPSTPAISADNRFALITDPYVAARDQPGEKGITISHFRRGDVLTVLGNTILPSADEKTSRLWIQTDKGWISSVQVRLYSDESRARRAGDKIR